MSNIIENGYHGRDTKILYLDYFDDSLGTVFIVRCLDFDIILGRITKDGYGDIKNAKQAIEYFNSFLPREDVE